MARPSSPRRRRSKWEVVHPDAAAIDIGARFHVVAIPPDRDPEPVRRFESFTQDLGQLADWLVEKGITTVAGKTHEKPLYDGLRGALPVGANVVI